MLKGLLGEDCQDCQEKIVEVRLLGKLPGRIVRINKVRPDVDAFVIGDRIDGKGDGYGERIG